MRGNLLAAVLLSALLTSGAAAAQEGVLSAPSYSLADHWEYVVTGRVTALEDVGNATGTLLATGTATQRVTQVRATGATLSWRGDLAVEGNFTLPDEAMPLEATLEGRVEIFHEEEWANPYALPLAFEDRGDFELTLSAGITIPYSASLHTTVNVTPPETYPVYPLEAGDQEFTFPTHLVTTFTVSFLGLELSNTSEEQVTSVVQLRVAEGGTVQVPAGTFTTTQVVLEAVEGIAPGPLQALFPGARQVAFYAPEVGNAVLFQFSVDDVEVGNATLRSFQYGTEPPFWQNPLFLGGLLAIPAAVLIFLYYRERRRGL